MFRDKRLYQAHSGKIYLPPFARRTGRKPAAPKVVWNKNESRRGMVLPTMLRLEKYPQFRQEATGRLLQAPARLGIRNDSTDRRCLISALKSDPNHFMATDPGSVYFSWEHTP